MILSAKHYDITYSAKLPESATAPEVARALARLMLAMGYDASNVGDCFAPAIQEEL